MARGKLLSYQQSQLRKNSTNSAGKGFTGGLSSGIVGSGASAAQHQQMLLSQQQQQMQLHAAMAGTAGDNAVSKGGKTGNCGSNDLMNIQGRSSGRGGGANPMVKYGADGQGQSMSAQGGAGGAPKQQPGGVGGVKPFPRNDLIPLSDEIAADGIVFAKMRNDPSVLVVFRTPEERLRNPERLNLDRRHLETIPVRIMFSSFLSLFTVMVSLSLSIYCCLLVCILRYHMARD
jgi:hypothetical protein